VQAALDGNVQPPLAVTAALELDDAPCALQAQIEDLRPQGLVLWRHAPIGGPALLDAWLQHLMLCLGLQQAQAAGQARAVDARTLWLAEDGQAEFAPVARPAELLQALLELYARGQRQPLQFYPGTSWEQAMPDSTPGKVRNIWTGREGSTRTWAESRDPWNRLALRGVADPLDVQFEMQSQAIYQPLLEHLEQTSATPEGSDEPA
jgi:exodeoxyribonuclease V gamma subunit